MFLVVLMDPLPEYGRTQGQLLSSRDSEQDISKTKTTTNF
jgi:hypothetical protein